MPGRRLSAAGSGPDIHDGIDDTVIQCYVDNQLSARQRIKVEEYLARRPDEARRIADIACQNFGLHMLFDDQLGKPLSSEAMRLKGELNQSVDRRRDIRRVGKFVTVGILCVLLFGTGLLVGRTESVINLTGVLTQNGFMPGDVAGTLTDKDSGYNAGSGGGTGAPPTVTQEALEKTTEKVLGSSAPDLEEFGLRHLATRVFDRNLPTETMQFRYETAGGRFALLYLTAADAEKGQEFRLARHGAILTVEWKRDGANYVVVSDVAREDLLLVCREISGRDTVPKAL